MNDELIKKLWACHLHLCDAAAMAGGDDEIAKLVKIAADVMAVLESLPGGTVNPFLKKSRLI